MFLPPIHQYCLLSTNGHYDGVGEEIKTSSEVLVLQTSTTRCRLSPELRRAPVLVLTHFLFPTTFLTFLHLTSPKIQLNSLSSSVSSQGCASDAITLLRILRSEVLAGDDLQSDTNFSPQQNLVGYTNGLHPTYVISGQVHTQSCGGNRRLWYTDRQTCIQAGQSSNTDSKTEDQTSRCQHINTSCDNYITRPSRIITRENSATRPSPYLHAYKTRSLTKHIYVHKRYLCTQSLADVHDNRHIHTKPLPSSLVMGRNQNHTGNFNLAEDTITDHHNNSFSVHTFRLLIKPSNQNEAFM